MGDWFFVSETHATLIAYWLSLLTTCRPQKQIPLATVHLSGARERETRAFRKFEEELWDGWRKRAGEKMFLSSLGASGEEKSLMWHIQNSADKQGSGPLLLIIKGAAVQHKTRLQSARSKLCSLVFKDLPTHSLFFPHD